MAATLRACRVLANTAVVAEHALVTFAGGLGAAAVPGQFAQVSFPGVSGALLPRPFSFYSAASDSFQLLSRTVGPGTGALAASRPGDELTVLGPLGHGFELARLADHAGAADAGALVLVAGGVGLPPLHYAAAFIRSGRAGRQASQTPIHALIGAARQELLLGVQELPALDVEVLVTTEDGSAGHRGRVTDLLGAQLGGRPALVLACGPHPMLAAVAAACAAAQVPCQVALEQPMACGFGVCLGCAVRSNREEQPYLLVCQDGPALDAATIAW